MSGSVPPQVVPLPPIIVGAEMDGAGNMILDDLGNPIIPSSDNRILSAIYALARRIEIMSQTIEQKLEDDAAVLIAANTSEAASLATIATSLTSIQQIIANLQAGSTISQATLDALQAAVGVAQSNATAAATAATTASTIAMGTGTGTGTATST